MVEYCKRLLSGFLIRYSFKSPQQGRAVGAFSGCWSPGMLARLWTAAAPLLALADAFNGAVIPPCLISPQTTLILHTEMLHCRARPPSHCSSPHADTPSFSPPPPLAQILDYTPADSLTWHCEAFQRGPDATWHFTWFIFQEEDH